MMLVWMIGILGAMLIAEPAAAAPRVTRVVAEAENLIITGTGAPGPVELIEMAPYEEAEAAGGRAGLRARAGRDGRFRARVARHDGPRDRIYSGWVARAEGAPVSPPRFVEGMNGVSRYREPFPRAASKKGLQVQMVEDAIALGVKHAALNVDLSRYPDLENRKDSLTWELNGETFRFRRRAVEDLDRRVKPLSDAGALVYLILLAYDTAGPEVRRLLLHPRYDPKSPNRLGAFNTATPEGVEWFTALVEFLAERYSRPTREHGRVVGYILGNEVNSHWWWYNMGPVRLAPFTEEYLRTLRVAWMAVRKASASARVYISLEHHWTLRFGEDEERAFPGKEFVDLLARRTTETGPFDWHVAYHPYPENLFEPRTWLDRTAEPHAGTPRITFKNLQVLTDYLRHSELRHAGRPRRVILSEQGFHTPDRPDGERDQAAAYCYAYYRASRLDGIDAFILHRHVDHKGEGGLKLGLWTWKEESPSPSEPDRKKPIYDVFKAADTPGWREAFRFALPVIGIRSWQELDAPRRSGRVRVVDHSLVDDGGTFLGLGVSYFTALWRWKNDRERCERDLAFLSRQGYNYFRMLSMVGWYPAWDGLEIAPVSFTSRAGKRVAAWPDYWERLRELIDVAHDRYGMRAQITIFADAQLMPDKKARIEHMRKLLSEVVRGREEKILMIEVANEAWQNGFPGERGVADLREFAGYLADQTQVPIAITSNHEGSFEELYAGSAADLATWHFSRDRRTDDGWKPVYDCWELGDRPGLPPVSSNEPIGPGSSVSAETEAIRLVMAAAFAYVAKLPAYVFHSEAGVFGKTRFEEMPGIDRFRPLMRLLPGDLANWRRNDGKEASAPFTAYAAGQPNRYGSEVNDSPDGCLRNTGSRKGDRFLCVPISIRPGGLTLEAREGARVRVYDPLTGKVIRQATLQAGETLSLPPGPGALLIVGTVDRQLVCGGAN